MATLLERMAVWRLRQWGFVPRAVPTSLGRVGAMVYEGPGKAPPVVLLHGVGSRGSHYRPLLRRLLPRAGRIVVPDFLGHGDSDVPEPARLRVGTLVQGMNEALDQLLDEPAVVYGNSMGGYGAMKYALHSPDRVRGLMVTSPAGAPLPPELRQVVVSQLAVDGFSDALRLAGSVMAHVSPVLRPLVAVAIVRQFGRPHIRSLLHSVGADDEFSPTELAQLGVPTQFLWGKAERLLHPQQFSFFRRHLPDHAVIEEPEDYSHLAYMERPDDLADRLMGFCEAVAAR